MNLEQLPKSRKLININPSVNTNASSILSKDGVFSASQRKLLDIYSNHSFIATKDSHLQKQQQDMKHLKRIMDEQHRESPHELRKQPNVPRSVYSLGHPNNLNRFGVYHHLKHQEKARQIIQNMTGQENGVKITINATEKNNGGGRSDNGQSLPNGQGTSDA